MTATNTKPELTALYETFKDLPFMKDKGCILYSGEASLAQPNGLYLLGINPGGSPIGPSCETELVDKIRNTTPYTNNYWDCEWEWRKKIRPAGQHILQKRIQSLLNELHPLTHEGQAPLLRETVLRRTLCTNLIFQCAAKEKDIPKDQSWEKSCWPVHEYLIQKTQPSLIICFGSRPYNYIKNRAQSIQPEVSAFSGHQSWRWRITSINLLDQQRLLVQIPHLSIYDVSKLSKSNHKDDQQTAFYNQPLLKAAIEKIKQG